MLFGLKIEMVLNLGGGILTGASQGFLTSQDGFTLLDAFSTGFCAPLLFPI